MGLKQLTPPTTFPITLAEAKLHLRVDSSEEDAIIQAAIASATSMCEHELGRCIMPQVWDLTLDSFPDAIHITTLPIRTLGVTYNSMPSGNSTILSPTDYALDNSSEVGPAYIVPAYGKEWPETRAQINAVQVRINAGYQDAASVPEHIKSWIKLMVGSLYANRESEQGASANASSKQLRFADRLLDRDRGCAI